MEQRGQKRPMIENDYPVAQGHPKQPLCQEPVATPALQIRLNQQEGYSMIRGGSSLSQPGKGELLVADFLYALRNRAKDNNEVFWRTFVVKYFVPGAKNRLCISNSRVVLPKDDWRCEICKHNLTDSLEVEFLPSLFRVKYESGTLEELWFLDKPKEYQNSSGQTVMDYEKATLETIYENLRVVHEGQLRVVLTPDLKIFSWDFCVRQFEEFVPKRLINTQLIQLEEAAHRFQSDAQNAPSGLSTHVLQDSCNSICNFFNLLATALELAKVTKPSIDRTFGFSQRSVQIHQVADVLAGKTMQKIVEMCKKPRASPIDSLKVFQAVSKLLSVKHAPSAPPREGCDPPLYYSKISPTVDLPLGPGSTSTPSSSNNPPFMSQHGLGPRPSVSYGAVSGSNEPSLGSSSQAGLSTYVGPEGFGSPLQFQKTHEGGGMASLFVGGETSDSFFNFEGASTSAPPGVENDLISGEGEDRNDESGRIVIGYNADDEQNQFILDWESLL